MADKNSKNITIVIIAVVVVIAAYMLMTAPDRRTPGEKIGDAIDSVSDGATKAGRELQDRTPAERVGDAIEDATDTN